MTFEELLAQRKVVAEPTDRIEIDRLRDMVQHDIDIDDVMVAGGELTVGYWGDWPGAGTQWYCAADLDGFGGAPWTNLAPGSGSGSGCGTGWTDPSVVWGPTMSMGLGFYTTTPLPAESVTWGSIKALFE